MRKGGALLIENVRRSFGPVAALDSVSLQIHAGEFFSLLGPSGCGKTTLLRILGGLDEPQSGSVRLDEDDLLGIPAHDRPVNTVFQSYALFPHLNVRDNIAFGLRMKKVAAAQLDSRVSAMMELVEVQKLASRKPAELSGGQRQRVALARALVNEPRVLLLDEPLAAVDQKLRKQLQADLLALQRRLGLTFVYVTHDQEEALRLSDRIAVMNHGRIEQVGAPKEVYDFPKTRFAAEFLGDCNLISANEAKLFFPRLAEGSAFFRPERVTIGGNGIEGTIRDITFSGATSNLQIESRGVLIKAACLNEQARELKMGASVFWSVPEDAVMVLPPLK